MGYFWLWYSFTYLIVIFIIDWKIDPIDDTPWLLEYLDRVVGLYLLLGLVTHYCILHWDLLRWIY